MNIFFKQCTYEDLESLRDFSCRTFAETFADMNSSANMSAYLKSAFDIEKVRSELLNSNSSFYFLYADHILTGYLKLNEAPAQTDIHDERSLEIERIYVSKLSQGKGFGQCLIDKATGEAVQRKKEYIWLGVWKENIKAIRFYKKNGFYEVGTHSFFVGDDEQTDYIMKKDMM